MPPSPYDCLAALTCHLALTRDINSVGQATELFGSDKGLLVCRPARLTRPWFSVPDGCYALVTRFGKDLMYEGDNPVWPAGFFWGPPWTKVSNIVTKQSVVFNMPVKGCKTQDNVTVQINLAVVFRIMGDVKCANICLRLPPIRIRSPYGF
jgi:regulator of protease activity HflC (stomatin/prohibitin superfamily)